MSSRYELGNSFFNNFGNAFKSNVPQRHQVKSLRERFINQANDYDTNIKTYDNSNINNNSSPMKKVSQESLGNKNSYNNFPEFNKGLYS